MLDNPVWLAMDLSGAVGTVALLRPGGELLEQGTLARGQHSENLLPEIERLLKAHGLVLSCVERFFTCNGPGSFTGLRVAYSALKAFALAHPRPIEVLDGHEIRALAYLAEVRLPPEQLDVVTQLTRDRFLVTQFECTRPRLGRTSQKIETTYTQGSLRLVDKPELEGIYFGLQAKYLGAHFLNAESRKTISEKADLISASPEYFGAKFT